MSSIISRQLIRRWQSFGVFSECGSLASCMLRLSLRATKPCFMYHHPTLESVRCTNPQHGRGFSSCPREVVPDPLHSENDLIPDGLLFDDDEDDIPSLDPEHVPIINPPTATSTLKIQRLSLENAQQLFDFMAPLLTYEDILNIKSKLQGFTKMCQQDDSKASARALFIAPYDSVLDRINAILNGDKVIHSPSLGRPRKNISVVDPWITTLLSQFMVPTAATPWKTHSDIVLNNTTFPPNINRIHLERNVHLWIQAKELSLVSDLFTYKNFKSNKKLSPNLKAEAEHLASILADRLPKDIHNQIMELLRYILDMDTKKNIHGISQTKNRRRYGLPKDTSSSIDNQHGAATTKTTTSPDQNNKTLLFFSNMKTCSNLHTHLIFDEILKFFYPTISKTQQDPLKGIEIPKSSSFKDSKVQNSWKRWMNLRKELCPVLMAAQHAYIDCLVTNIDPSDNPYEEDIDELFKHLDIKDDDDDDGSIQNVKKCHVTSAKEKRESRMYLTLNILHFQDFLIPSSDSNAISSETHNMHNVNPFPPSTFHASPDNVVFLDNLPIDITEDELKTLYTRCGQLESIHIFNRKPALDPGEKSSTEQKLLLKSNRLSGFTASHRRFRKRTPVYAMLKFQEKDGYNTATMDALRIFGMIIRRHAVRSIPNPTMTKLFVENIPVGHPGSVIEEKLCELFFPFMRVYIEIGMDPNKDARNVELRFPSFESCYFAFSLLAQKENVDSLFAINNVQWMKTPVNSMDYWTRRVMIES